MTSRSSPNHSSLSRVSIISTNPPISTLPLTLVDYTAGMLLRSYAISMVFPPQHQRSPVMALPLELLDLQFRVVCRLRCSLPESESVFMPTRKKNRCDAYFSKNETLLAKLCRLSQMHTCQGRRLQTLSSGMISGDNYPVGLYKGLICCRSSI